MRDNPITPSVDFDGDGVQHGFLKLPRSHDDSAWGSLMIPISVARNGKGPTILLTGGNHGDEYEGPVALFDLARRIDHRELSGRVIIIPGMNYPAMQVARRTSPIDGGNMNRSFPGSPTGTVTEKIADYFQRVLLPMADVVVDIHSGGRTLDFVPLCAAHELDDKTQQQRCVDMMTAFNAPWSLMLRELDSVGMYDDAAEEMGKTFITTELGGGGSARATNVAVAINGIRNVMIRAGVLQGEVTLAPSRNLVMPDDRCFVTSETAGLFAPCVELGAPVSAGQPVAQVYDIQRTGQPPREYCSLIDGIFIARHFPGLIAMGDIVGVVAVESTTS